MTAPDSITVSPTARVMGDLQVPGDKSVSHRAAMLTALASGTSTIHGFLASEDCLDTLAAVAALGAGVEREGGEVTVTGTGGSFWAILARECVCWRDCWPANRLSAR